MRGATNFRRLLHLDQERQPACAICKSVRLTGGRKCKIFANVQQVPSAGKDPLRKPVMQTNTRLKALRHCCLSVIVPCEGEARVHSLMDTCRLPEQNPEFLTTSSDSAAKRPRQYRNVAGSRMGHSLQPPCGACSTHLPTTVPVLDLYRAVTQSTHRCLCAASEAETICKVRRRGGSPIRSCSTMFVAFNC